LGRTYVAQGQKDAALRVYKTLQTLDAAQAKKLYEEINGVTNTQTTVERRKTSGGPQSSTTQSADLPHGSSNGGPGTSGPSSATTTNNVTALKAQADKYWEAKDYPRAVEAYKRVVGLDPSNADSYYRLALYYYEQKQWPQSISAWDHVLAVRQEASALLLKGNAHRYLKQYDEALKAYRDAIALKQDSQTLVGAHVFMGRTYLEMGKKDEARQVYRALQRIDPNAAQQLLDEINKQ